MEKKKKLLDLKECASNQAYKHIKKLDQINSLCLFAGYFSLKQVKSEIDPLNPIKKTTPWPMNLKEGLNNVFLYGHRLGLKKSNEMGQKSMFSKGKQTITNGLFLHIFIIYKHNGHQFDMVGCTRVHYSYYMYKLWLFIRFWLLKLKKLDKLTPFAKKKCNWLSQSNKKKKPMTH